MAQQTRRQQFEAEMLYDDDAVVDPIVKALPSHASVNYRPDLDGVEVLITHDGDLMGTWAFIGTEDEAVRLTNACREGAMSFVNERGGVYRFPRFAS